METRYDATLEEAWRIKREIASEYPSLEAYFKGMMDYQDDLRKQGVNLVCLPASRVVPAMLRPGVRNTGRLSKQS